MARAKRTERAEARRRYRAATVGTENGDETFDVPAVPAAAVPRGSRDRRLPGPDSGAEPAQRAGFLSSLRTAAGPADLRGDLRALPSVILRSRAGWVPALAIAATAGG